MNPSSPDIMSSLRQRTVGEIVDGAFRIYRRNFRTFLLIVAVVYVPVRLLSFGVDVFLLGKYTPSEAGSISGSLAASSVISQADTLKMYLEEFLTYLAKWALVAAVGAGMLGRSISFGEAYEEVRRRLRDVLGLIGLQTLIAVGFLSPAILVVVASFLGGGQGSLSSVTGLLACTGIFTLAYYIIQIRLTLMLPAAVTEGLSPREALRRSWDLTRNYWWRTFALSVVLSILSTIVTLGPGAVLTGLAATMFRLDYNTSLAITQGIGIFAAVLFVPVETGAVVLYYFDQRVRTEGYDLDSAIALRYEGDQAAGYEQAAGGGYDYGQNSGGYTVPVPSGVPLGTEGEATLPLSRNVARDEYLYSLLASGQSDRAMRTFRKRMVKVPESLRGTGSAGPAKRKTDRTARGVRGDEAQP